MIDKIKIANAYADSQNIQVPTKDKSPYPTRKSDEETYGQYRARINKLISEGFDISRLSHSDYTDYCRGNYASDEYEYNEVVAYFEDMPKPEEEDI
jgi:hypothetical protein